MISYLYSIKDETMYLRKTVLSLVSILFVVMFVSCANNGVPKDGIKTIKEVSCPDSNSFLVDIVFNTPSSKLKKIQNRSFNKRTLVSISARYNETYPVYTIICGFLANGLYDADGLIGYKVIVHNPAKYIYKRS